MQCALRGECARVSCGGTICAEYSAPSRADQLRNRLPRRNLHRCKEKDSRAGGRRAGKSVRRARRPRIDGNDYGPCFGERGDSRGSRPPESDLCAYGRRGCGRLSDFACGDRRGQSQLRNSVHRCGFQYPRQKDCHHGVGRYDGIRRAVFVQREGLSGFRRAFGGTAA